MPEAAMQQPAPSQPLSPQRTPATTQAQPAGQGNMPPEAEQGVRRVVMAGMKAIYDERVSAQIVNALRSEADEPAKALAQATAMLVLGLYEKSGGKMPKGYLIPAAQILLRVVADFATRLEIFQIDQAVAMQASQMVVKVIVQMMGQGGGPTPPGAAAAAMPAPAQQQQPPAAGGMVGRAMQMQQRLAA